MAQSESSRDALLDSLADDFVRRFRVGERPALTEYIQRHPELETDIRALFPSLVEIEQAKAPPPQAPPSPETVVRQLGDYRILRELGRGGMGVVYEAEQVSLGRHVALKVLPATAVHDARALERFRREAKAAARLHHTNIVPVFEVGRAGDTCFYAMQYIAGQPLDDVITEVRRLREQGPGDRSAPSAVSRAASILLSGSFPPPVNQTADYTPQPNTPAALAGPSAASGSTATIPARDSSSTLGSSPRAYHRSVTRIVLQAAEALAYAHARGVIHRDIKPSNLLLDEAGVVWVADFGLARTEDAGLTHTNEVVGTLRYMAPERFRGQCDARADVYALGLTLYELLTLRPAFDASDQVRLVDQLLHETPPRPRLLDRGIPRDLETVALKAMERDPGQRYQTAAALAEDLRRVLDDRPVLARRPSTVERLTRWCRRNPVLAGLTTAVAALLLLTAIGGAVVAFRLSDLADKEKKANQELEVKVQEEAKRTAEEKARANREQDLRKRGIDAEKLHENGQRLESQRLWKEALHDYDAALKLRDDQAPLWLARGRLYLGLGLFDEAANDFQRAFTLSKPGDPKLWFFHAALRLHQGDAAGYQAVCAQMIEHFSNPGDPILVRWLVRACTLGADAIPRSEQLKLIGWAESLPLGQDTGLPAPLLVRAALLRADQRRKPPGANEQELNRFGQLLAVLEAHRQDDPKRAADQLLAVEQALNGEMNSLLAPSVRPAAPTPISPKFPPFFGGVGPMSPYWGPGSFPGLPVMGTLRPSVLVTPPTTLTTAPDQLGDRLAELLLYREAVARVRGKPIDHPLTGLLCVHNCLVLGRTDQGLALMDRAIEAAPKNPLCRIERARFLSAMKRWPQAKADLRQALKLTPPADKNQQGAVCLQAAQLYADHEDWADAETCVRLVFNPKETTIFWPPMAQILAAQKKWDEAAPLYARIVEWTPDTSRDRLRIPALRPTRPSAPGSSPIEDVLAEICAHEPLYNRVRALRPRDERLPATRLRMLAEQTEWGPAAVLALEMIEQQEQIERHNALPLNLYGSPWNELVQFGLLFERVVKARPKDARPWLARAFARRDKNRPDEAASDLLAALERADPRTRDTIYGQIVTFPRAFDRAVAARPKDAELWLRRGRYRMGSDWKGAEADFAEARKRSGDDVKLLAALAGDYAAYNNRTEQALEVFDILVRKSPENTDYLRGRATALERLGHWKEAAEDYLKLIDRSPEDVSQPKNRLQTYHLLAQNDSLFVAATDARPKDAQLWVSRGWTLVGRKDYRGAREAAAEATRRGGKGYDVLIGLGLEQARSVNGRPGNLEEAASTLAEALAQVPSTPLFPDRWDQRRHVAHAQIAGDDLLFERVARLRKDDVHLWLERFRSTSGLPWNSLGSFQPRFRQDAATDALTEAVRLAPKEPHLLIEGAVFYAHHNVRDWDRAADHLDRALALLSTVPPGKPEHSQVRGAAVTSAPEVFDRLAKKRPQDARLRADRAWQQAQQGRVAEADRWMAEAQRIKPNDRDLLWFRARYHAGLGRWSQAAEDVETARKLRDFDNSSQAWAEGASFLAAAGRTEAYREVCQQMRERFKDSKELFDGLNLAFVFLLDEKGVGELQRLADKAEAALKDRGSDVLAVEVAALARRRLGKAESAVTLIRDYLKKTNPAYWSSSEVRLRLNLALALRELHRDDEAQSELALAAKKFAAFFPENPGKLALQPSVQDGAVAMILGRQAGPKYAALVKEARVPKPPVVPVGPPPNLDVGIQRARNEAMHRRWEAAAAEVLAVWKSGDLGPNSFTWLEAASYLAAAGKTREHRDVCTRMRARFKDSTDPQTKQRIAFACLLAADVAPAKETLRLAEEARKADPKPTWNVYPAALALRRAGQAQAAEQLIRGYLKSRAPMPDEWVDSVTFSLALGFALADQKKPKEARAAWERALKVLDQPDPSTPTVKRLWQPPHAWAAAEALARQARPLLKDPTAAPR